MKSIASCYGRIDRLKLDEAKTLTKSIFLRNFARKYGPIWGENVLQSGTGDGFVNVLDKEVSVVVPFCNGITLIPHDPNSFTL